MPPTVVWTNRAERRLETELLRGSHTRAALVGTVADLSGRLAGAFPRADAVVVLEVYLGFRPRDREFILLVDVRDRERPGTCIVKLADDDRLRQELEAWLNCRPIGFHGNGVFMGLEPHYRPDYPHRLAAVVYQDAQPHIGADETVWLETAALRSVRFGSPALDSVLAAIESLYTHLNRVLYGVFKNQTAGVCIELNPQRRGGRRPLGESYAAWGDALPMTPAGRVRQQVNTEFGLEAVDYTDPLIYLQYLEAEWAAGSAADLRPRLLRGRAHGDLHGRNVLVGVENNRVDAPAVYDYENMSDDNLIGWDFVKLETELKVRALEVLVRPGERRLEPFARAVERFEADLAARTYQRQGFLVSPPGPPAMPALTELILHIRQQAELHLGINRGRGGDWLHEYFFLLACYGVSTGRFENPTDRQRVAALVSAGSAAFQYQHGSRPRNPIGDRS